MPCGTVLGRSPAGSSARCSTCTALVRRQSRPAEILTDYGFEGFRSARFPADGLRRAALFGSRETGRLRAVSLPQDFRNFDFLMPWEGAEYRLPGDEKATAGARRTVACARSPPAPRRSTRRPRRTLPRPPTSRPRPAAARPPKAAEQGSAQADQRQSGARGQQAERRPRSQAEGQRPPPSGRRRGMTDTRTVEATIGSVPER